MMPVDERKLETQMFLAAQELRGKDINKMIMPSMSTTIGICHWFHERLASVYEVREVNCWQDDQKVQAVLRAP